MDEEAKKITSELRSEIEGLKRELAMCSLCQRICSPEEHAKKLTDVRYNPLKLKCFLTALGRKQR